MSGKIYLEDEISEIKETQKLILSMLNDIRSGTNHNTTNNKEVMTTLEVATLLNVSSYTVRKRCKEDNLPYYGSGKNCYYLRSEIDSWLNSKRHMTEADAGRIADKYISRNPLNK